MADRKYYICYTCRTISCSSRTCESPKAECQEICNTCIDQDNVNYDFCTECKSRMLTQFRHQMGWNVVPFKKRLRTEER